MHQFQIYIGFALSLLFLLSLCENQSEGFNYTIDHERKYIENGNVVVIGDIENNDIMPFTGTISVNVTEENTESTINGQLLSSIIYPGESVPFKIALNQREVNGKVFLTDIKEIYNPKYDVFINRYENLAGKDKSLVGEVINNSSLIFENVSVYASVHAENKTHIDSAKSDTLKTLMPYDEGSYSMAPSLSVKDDVYYYSCAGIDVNAPWPTLDLGNGKSIPFNLKAAAEITDFRYDGTTDSIKFTIKHFSPVGGPLSLKIPHNQTLDDITVLIDSKESKGATITNDGEMITIKAFVQPDNHEIEIKDIS